MLRVVFNRPVFARARRLCLSLPEVQEASSWGHPNFRVRKTTFCAFEMIHGRPSIAFRMTAADAAAAVRRNGFFPTPYGRGLWASLWVDGRVNGGEVERLLERSYRLAAGKRLASILDSSRTT